MNISQAFKPRTPEPVMCSGNDLAQTLAGLRERGYFPWALDVVGVSNFKVSYFERSSGLAPTVAVRQCSDGTMLPAGENPVAQAKPSTIRPAQGPFSQVQPVVGGAADHPGCTENCTPRKPG